MAKRIKKKYSYWELPEWENEEIEITRIFREDDKMKMTLRYDEQIFIVRIPKKSDWEKLTSDGLVPKQVRITKVKNNEKNATLKLHK